MERLRRIMISPSKAHNDDIGDDDAAPFSDRTKKPPGPDDNRNNAAFSSTALDDPQHYLDPGAYTKLNSNNDLDTTGPELHQDFKQQPKPQLSTMTSPSDPPADVANATYTARSYPLADHTSTSPTTSSSPYSPVAPSPFPDSSALSASPPKRDIGIVAGSSALGSNSPLAETISSSSKLNPSVDQPSYSGARAGAPGLDGVDALPEHSRQHASQPEPQPEPVDLGTVGGSALGSGSLLAEPGVKGQILGTAPAVEQGLYSERAGYRDGEGVVDPHVPGEFPDDSGQERHVRDDAMVGGSGAGLVGHQPSARSGDEQAYARDSTLSTSAAADEKKNESSNAKYAGLGAAAGVGAGAAGYAGYEASQRDKPVMQDAAPRASSDMPARKPVHAKNDTTTDQSTTRRTAAAGTAAGASAAAYTSQPDNKREWPLHEPSTSSAASGPAPFDPSSAGPRHPGGSNYPLEHSAPDEKAPAVPEKDDHTGRNAALGAGALAGAGAAGAGTYAVMRDDEDGVPSQQQQQPQKTSTDAEGRSKLHKKSAAAAVQEEESRDGGVVMEGKEQRKLEEARERERVEKERRAEREREDGAKEREKVEKEREKAEKEREKEREKMEKEKEKEEKRREKEREKMEKEKEKEEKQREKEEKPGLMERVLHPSRSRKEGEAGEAGEGRESLEKGKGKESLERGSRDTGRESTDSVGGGPGEKIEKPKPQHLKE